LNHKKASVNGNEKYLMPWQLHTGRPVDGFEFKFTRDEESVAWYTESFGGDDYTVVNIRLDIRPIRITGPLYDGDE
jgi:hypothetical protein